ncbi:thiamine-phosphate kinase [Microbulbifer guangxiensis]|uniref:thiamine-phosphate kinase n=1 Tax=Microbulbifer guangxiensis TaxID=2904249 RepID=UPI001F008C75|nr:thiamine-phosphate kinase [Microbulbifer guangxiensis]
MARVGEFDIIRDYFAGAPTGDSVILGIGDDCALLQPPAGSVLATSVDTLVAGRHFPEAADPAKIASRALRVNLSDLAAMGAKPLWFTLALTLPTASRKWLQGFSRGLLETAREYGISLVGGDTTAGPLSITVQVTGCAQKPLRRDGASVGDAVYVSGPLGAAAAALRVVLGKEQVDSELSQAADAAFYWPEPQLALAESIAPLASAAIDISDGLLADLGHICRASGVSAEVELEALPVAPLARELAGTQARELAATGGDDYQLCFTVPAARVAELEQMDTGAVRIGTLVDAAGEPRVLARRHGQSWAPKHAGYQHF